MTHILKTPFLGVNDSEAILSEWLVAAGTKVVKGHVVCLIETAKAILEVVADAEGYLFPVVEPGRAVAVHQKLAFISDQANFDWKQADAGEDPIPGEKAVFTKKAEILARRYALDEERIRAFAGTGKITEQVVEDFHAAQVVQRERRGIQHRQRIGIIGGVGGGGTLIIIDSLIRQPAQQAVCIFEQDAQFHGREVLGVPVVGTLELLDEWLRSDKLDGVVIAFNRDLAERGRVFEALKNRGVPFCNVIDPGADLRSFVELGTGNILLGRTYVGACSRIGDNNFISANVALEHGNTLGSHNAFGPGVFTSGNVTIGDRVRFATGIFVEPGVTIGSDAVIASGRTVTVDVAPGEVLKTIRR